MRCAATVDYAGEHRQCVRTGHLHVGPLYLCSQHADAIESHYRGMFRVDQLRAEHDQLWLALRREQHEWDWNRRSVEFTGACVYLAHSRHMPGRVKIGYTTNLRQRMASLDAIAVAAIAGTKKLETEMHKRFRHLRVDDRREWFLSDRSIIEAFRA